MTTGDDHDQTVAAHAEPLPVGQRIQGFDEPDLGAPLAQRRDRPPIFSRDLIVTLDVNALRS